MNIKAIGAITAIGYEPTNPAYDSKPSAK